MRKEPRRAHGAAQHADRDQQGEEEEPDQQGAGERLGGDPIQRLSDADLVATRDSGAGPPAPNLPGRTMELEHSGVPQRIRNWLEALGFKAEEARRLTEVFNPAALPRSSSQVGSDNQSELCAFDGRSSKPPSLAIMSQVAKFASAFVRAFLAILVLSRLAKTAAPNAPVRQIFFIPPIHCLRRPPLGVLRAEPPVDPRSPTSRISTRHTRRSKSGADGPV